MTTVSDFQHTDDVDEALQDGLWLYIDPDETVMEINRDGRVVVATFINDYIIEENLNYDDYKNDKCFIYDHFCQSAINEEWV